MITMKDVARVAGVSVATVSNYLNNTKSVGTEKKLKIEAAIKELNYVLDPNAQLLKKGQNNKIGIILPKMNSFYNSMYDGLLKIILKSSYKVELVITNDDMNFEREAIERLIKEKCTGLLIVTCQPYNIKLFESLERRDISFVLMEREVGSKAFSYIGFNNYNTIYSIVENILDKTENVALVVGREGIGTEDDCVKAFRDVYAKRGLAFNNNRILRTRSSRGNSFYDSINFIEKIDNKIDYIVASNSAVAKGIKAAIETKLKKDNCTIICLGENVDEVFDSTEGIFNTPRSPYILGMQGSEMLLSKIKSENRLDPVQRKIDDPTNLLNYFNKFITASSQEEVIADDNSVKVLILEDPLCGGLESIIPQFEKTSGIKVQIESCSMNNYYEFLTKRMSQENSPDLFLIDVPWIDYFASEGLIGNLDDYIEEDKIYNNTFVQKLLKGFGVSNGSLFALPYSYTNQLLFYRKDIFDDIEIKKNFEEAHGFSLKPPKNWVEFNTIAKFFTKAFNPNSPVEYGTSLAVAYPQAVAPEFLLRLWSLGGDIFDKEGKVIIDNKISKRAIENYCECFSYATPNAFINMPSDQVREFCEGKVAMIVAFFSYGSEMIHSSNLLEEDKIGFSIVPGKVSALSGWSMCLNEKSKNKESALKFLKWICGPEVAIKRAFLEGQSSQEFVYESTELMNFYPWLSTALQSLEFSSKRSMPKVNGRYPEPEKAIEDILGNLIYDILKQPQCFEISIKNYKDKLQKLLFSVKDY